MRRTLGLDDNGGDAESRAHVAALLTKFYLKTESISMREQLILLLLAPKIGAFGALKFRCFPGSDAISATRQEEKASAWELCTVVECYTPRVNTAHSVFT